MPKQSTKTAYTRKLTSQKLDQIKPENLVQIHTSKDSFKVAWSLWDLETIEIQEAFALLMVNRANKVIGWALLSTGGAAGTVVDMKMLFSHALLCGAAAFIAYHNHPSGNLQPSQADIELTKKMRDAGKMMDIPLLDHLILAPDGSYYSFSEMGGI